ncbi:NFX1-type zinc finger-containing protein 1-like isoform X1 [Maniola hyperantus]|uniref:NFX1-type zinc finger-containing protein 1-like isoform X1 n=1 Tax=Aphantopus hyperantus TaxID=2795564 RepID=UPI001568EF0D|nr:NFX1-type zinc finger-containing protein 1-like isoform X2 [Maniola hyperantus]
MSETTKSLRIDWFDGTVIEETRPSTSQFSEEDVEPPPPRKLQESEKKPIGFKRLQDLSLLMPPILNLELSNRPGFWLLLNTELKGDFIVLIVKILGLLYKSLDSNEKSKIGFLLRSKFEKSNFLIQLKDYLCDLPKVKIVDKRINMQLWDDVESFYFNVLKFCEAIFHYGGHSKEFLKDLYDVVEMAELSALGVQEVHMEPVSERFYEEISLLRIEVLKSIDNSLEEATSIEDPVTSSDPNSFRNLNIFPSKGDLLGHSNVKIVPNIVNGAYSSVEHYLDLQFKLLREDCFGPLREGICKYLENPSKRRHENIRVYPKVRILRTYVSNNRVGHLVDIAWTERVANNSVDYRKYAYNKRLMFGSLLLFTGDNFQNILCASVLDSNLDLLRYGYIAVAFQNPVSSKVFSEPYLMVESEVFFEPYHRVLKVLQNSRSDNLPMRKYIVDVQKETNPPAYLTPQTIYSIRKSSNKNEELSFPVLDTNQWPTSQSFGLDQSQMDAYSFALTREFAVIQGPPGTGKTYLGVKIASTILRNLSLEGTPMLIICYTNHALDQFLEGILNVTTNIVRLGSQSKSKILEPYNLNAMRTKMKSKYSYLYANKRSELEKIFKEMTDIQTDIEKCEKEIVSYKTIKAHLKIGDDSFELKDFGEDATLSWLFGHLDSKQDQVKDGDKNDILEDWEKQYEELNVSDKIETCFSEQWALKEIDSMENSIKYLKDISDEHLEGQKMTDKFQNQIERIGKRLECFKKYMALLYIEKNENHLPNTRNPYNLTVDERWNVYFNAVETIKCDLINKMNALLDQHNTCNDELNEVSTLIDSEVVKTARVVAVTTTLAARRHQLMKRLECPIVIVEEAAEVLEAHIVASLTNKCQHLILIGDHKQLRPTAAHYELAKNYNLEISLFERMIRNGIHARTLTIQRRMRANFVELLVPVIYDKLDSHPSVLSYPSVRGMRDNLYFCTHDVLEDSEGLEDSWSHKNTLEAKWCVSLANYLRRKQYDSNEITILATYNGQASLIKEISKKYPLLQEVKITVVDNYQGEENRIVILSLVRSNRDGKIGFLSAPNRICVALSRAKEGFYMFGNMNVLRSASPIWRFIHDKLVAQNAIGKQVVLRCDTHNDNTLHIYRVEDLDKCLKGSCLKNCDEH